MSNKKREATLDAREEISPLSALSKELENTLKKSVDEFILKLNELTQTDPQLALGVCQRFNIDGKSIMKIALEKQHKKLVLTLISLGYPVTKEHLSMAAEQQNEEPGKEIYACVEQAFKS